MKLNSLNRRVTSLESLRPTESDTRQGLGWPAYKNTLLKYLADYPQKGLLEDIQRAFEDLESRPSPVTDANVFSLIDPVLLRHDHGLNPNPQLADHKALIARFKAVGAVDEDLEDFYKYVRRYEIEDKIKAAGGCYGCGADIRNAPYQFDCTWLDGELIRIPWCADCHKKHYPR